MIAIKPYVDYNEKEIVDLYLSVGWKAYTDSPQTLQLSFQNSILVLGAYDADKLIGLIRVVGDGYTVVLVQDILLYPEYQRKGIGTRLIQAVFDRFSSVRQIQLVTDNTPKTKAFYQSLGFKELSEFCCCGFMKG